MKILRSRLCLTGFAAFIILLISAHTVYAKVITFEREFTYRASDADSKLYCRAIALEQVKKLLLNELGVYLESETEVRNFQLTKDQMTAITAGIVATEIIDEKFDGRDFTLRARIEADPDEVVKSVDSLRKDRQRMKDLEEARGRAEEAMNEVEKLREEISHLKEKRKIELFRRYDKAVKKLSAADWLEKGFSLYKRKKYNDSVYAFSQAIELVPEFTIAYYNRGNIFARNLGKYQESIMDYDKVLELNPEYTKAYNNRGLSYGKLGSHQLAIRDFDRAIELNPGYIVAYINRGLSYSKLNNFDMAIEDYNKAVELKPDYAKVYDLRGITYKKSGKLEKACSDWERACELRECENYKSARKKGICK